MSLRCIKKKMTALATKEKNTRSLNDNSVTVEHYRIHSKHVLGECPCHTSFGNTISALNNFPSNNHQGINFKKEFHAKIELSLTTE